MKQTIEVGSQITVPISEYRRLVEIAITALIGADADSSDIQYWQERLKAAEGAKISVTDALSMLAEGQLPSNVELRTINGNKVVEVIAGRDSLIYPYSVMLEGDTYPTSYTKSGRYLGEQHGSQFDLEVIYRG